MIDSLSSHLFYLEIYLMYWSYLLIVMHINPTLFQFHSIIIAEFTSTNLFHYERPFQFLASLSCWHS